MHFDDRLATVLRLPVRGTAIARIQYRQLLDILGRVSPSAHSETTEAAYQRLAELNRTIDPASRADMLRDPHARLHNPRLIALLAEDEPGVATAAIAAARLPEAEWLTMVPALPVRARGILRHRRDLGPSVEALLERLGITDRGLPPCDSSDTTPEQVLELDAELAVTPEPWVPVAADVAQEEPEAAAPTTSPVTMLHIVPPAPPPAPLPSDEGIGALVRRIEQFRRARENGDDSAGAEGGDAPRLPLEDGAREFTARLAAFDFTTDAAGRVNWADGVAAPMTVGLRLVASAASRGTNTALSALLRHRQPLRGVALTLDGAPAIAGAWQVDALPRFNPANGHFIGYSGRFRRPPTLDGQAVQPAPSTQADRMREILHELRTPANAIQVAAEIILQQLFGPTPHEYRALASAIVGDAANVFAGFDELDRLVKLDSGAMMLNHGSSDLGEVLSSTIARLRAWTDPRRSGFSLTLAPGSLDIHIDPVEAERLFWRLLAALAGAAAPDEILPVCVTRHDDDLSIAIALPASLHGRSDENLLGGAGPTAGASLSAGMFGIGFTLRLCEAEAKAAGGSLKRYDNELRLILPGLAADALGHSRDV